MLIILIIIAMLAACVYIHFSAGKRLARILTKAFASCCFVGIALYRLRTGTPEPADRLLLWGLCCGLLGDVLLSLRRTFPVFKDPFFIAGLAVFAIGHFFYLNYFSCIGTVRFFGLAAGLILFAVLSFGKYIFAIQLGNKEPAVSVYLALLGLLCGLSAGNMLTGGAPLRFHLFAASLFFTCSDMLLGLSYFGKQQYRYSHAASSAAYYLAQIMFAAAVCAR